MPIVRLLLALCLSTPVLAQDRYLEDVQEPTQLIRQSLPKARLGETARSAADQIGQRQTHDELAAEVGIEPMGRINGRIQNRVQSRIRNRIDRYYDPQANATSPFAVADDRARTAGRPRR